VSATDLLTENSERVRVVSPKWLRPEDIQRMINEAGATASEDRRKREQVEAGIQADNAISAAEMLMEEIYSLGAEPQAEEIWGAVLKVKQALASGQGDEIRCRSAELRNLLGVAHQEAQRLTK
jgi:molecular chaperone DnaK (HSP70)